MKYFITEDLNNGPVIGTASQAFPGYNSAPIPETANADKFWWYELVGGVVSVNAEIAIPEARAERIVHIKEEAFTKIAALDWKLERAREREDASWESLEAVNEVLAERESIRRSSDAAEVAVNGLTNLDDILNFQWEVSVQVSAPRRVTRQQFLDRLTSEETADIIEAAQTSSSIAAWILRLENADFVNLDDPAVLMAMEALEIAGLIVPGRAQEIVS